MGGPVRAERSGAPIGGRLVVRNGFYRVLSGVLMRSGSVQSKKGRVLCAQRVSEVANVLSKTLLQKAPV